MLCQILRNCQCNWLQASYSAPRTFASSIVFPEKFCFARIRLDPLGGQVLRHGCLSMMVRDSHSLLRTWWSAVIKSQKCSRSGHDCTSTCSARSDCYLRLQADITISVVRECENTRCLPEPDSTFVRRSIGSSWNHLEVSWLPCSGFRQGSVEVSSSTKFSLNSWSHQAIHAIYLFVLFRILHVYFCFRFLWFHAAGLPEALHSYFHFFLALDFRCICFHQKRKPVMKMIFHVSSGKRLSPLSMERELGIAFSLTGNVSQSSAVIRFHFLEFTWIFHRIHLFLHMLRLWSESLNCLVIFFYLLHWNLFYSLFLSSLDFSHFVHIGDLSISENLLLLRQ